MMDVRPARRGFTLIELMIAVAIIGVLAATALPAFNVYMMNAKAAEVPENLSVLYKGAVAYWERPIQGTQGIAATSASHCVATQCCGLGTMQPPMFPTAQKRLGDFTSSAVFQALGFTPVGGLYGSYAMATDHAMTNCGHKEGEFWGAGGNLVYIGFGVLDLDGDGMVGGYSMQVGIRDDQLFRQPAFGSIEDGLAVFPDFGGAACPFCADGFVD